MGIDHNTAQDILKAIRDVLAREANGRICIGYQKIALSTSAISRLTVPTGATSAEITVESGGSTNASVAARFTTDNSTSPATGAAGTNVEGVPIGDFDTVEILNQTNLNAFRCIAADSANTKYLKVQYYQ